MYCDIMVTTPHQQANIQHHYSKNYSTHPVRMPHFPLFQVSVVILVILTFFVLFLTLLPLLFHAEPVSTN